jgi:hypothetical protein
MTESEVLYILQDEDLCNTDEYCRIIIICDNGQETSEIKEIVFGALDKQIAKKPLNLKETNDGSIRMEFKSGECPCCGNYINGDDDEYYCSHKYCGQKLDWSL